MNKNKKELVGNILNIQRYSIHDGPGIRTTVFLKGCPLRCFWCQNPESQSIKNNLNFRIDKCNGCKRCIDSCKSNAISYKEKIILKRDKCNFCGDCTLPKICSRKAIKIEGKEVNINEVIDEVLSDYNIFVNSGGGLTISGGECTMQPKFTAELLKVAHDNAVNTCIETTGYCSWKTLKKILDNTDYIYYDLKCIDNNKHIKGTGKPNTLIIENLIKIAKGNYNLHIRMPLIPGFNDTHKDVEEVSFFIRDKLNLDPSKILELLPYNNLGESKYERIGLTPPKKRKSQSTSYIEELNKTICKFE